MKHKQYNACFRLRKKGFTIHTKAKVIIVNSDIEDNKTIKMLVELYGFILQKPLFEI